MTTQAASGVNQSRARAGGDNVAGDKVSTTNNNYFESSMSAGVIGQLADRLTREMETNSHFRDRIETLQFFFEKVSHDGIDGLEAKLSAASRQDEQSRALRMKEMFVMIMTKYSYFHSAQMILAHLLAFAEDEFKCHVAPHLESLSRIEIDNMMGDRIVEPIVRQAGATPLQITRVVANGLIYWLAEQCYVRWHG